MRNRLRAPLLFLLPLALAAPISLHADPPARQEPAQPQLAGPGATLRAIVATGRLDNLRWPDFSDYRSELRDFYLPTDYALAWSANAAPTPQALALFDVFRSADDKGLNIEDYDGPRWAARIEQLRQSPTPGNLERFDAAVTVCLMRYISDLHIGKANPRYFHFGFDIEHKKYDLSEFVRERVVRSSDVKAVLAGVEPPFPVYRRIQQALEHYLALAQHDTGELLPVPPRAVRPGARYPGLPRLAQLLRLLGDLPLEANLPPHTRIYRGALVHAVKRFQERHGLEPDGLLGPDTVAELNTPLARRIRQFQLTLERLRWLPHEFAQPPIVVNIPEYRLRAFDENLGVAFSMNVVVGQAYGYETPAFADTIEEVVFRPYWNVPLSLQRDEILPALEKDPAYLAKNDFEVVTHAGELVTGELTPDVLRQLQAGTLEVRQRPGPKNALDGVKILFPNSYDVYLHGTPATELFSKARRDFSHGCIRVENPALLAVWVLRHNPGWDLEKVEAAMRSGVDRSAVTQAKDNQHVRVATPIPVLIFYATAVVTETGEARFFDDLYGYDAALEQVLARGYPYPAE